MLLKQNYDIGEILAHPLTSLRATKFTGSDFTDTNASLILYRTERDGIMDPLVFYIHCLANMHPNEDVASHMNDNTKAEHISKEDFLKHVDKRLNTLRKKYEFLLKGDFVDAIKLKEKDNDVSLLCETTEELVFFNWKTTS
jgi:hypothetical protein